MATITVIEKAPISSFEVKTTAKDTDVLTGLVNGNNANITAGAIANLVTKARLNLDKVANIGPSEMPVSDAQREELNKKMDKDEVLPIERIEGLTDALANKLDKDGTIAISQVTNLPEELEALKTGDVSVDRIPEFTDKVDEIINGREDLKLQVIKGPMAW